MNEKKKKKKKKKEKKKKERVEGVPPAGDGYFIGMRLPCLVAGG